MPEHVPVIALVTDAIAPYHRGGKEERYAQLTPRLAQRADIHVFTMNWWHGPRTISQNGVTYHAICPALALYRGSRRSVLQAVAFSLCCLRLLTHRFDVIEADHMPYLPLATLKIVSVLRRKRLVVTWHECWGLDYWREYLGPLGVIGWLCERLALMLPDAIIAASPQTAGRLRAQVRASVPVESVPNGVSLDVIAAAGPAERRTDLIVVGRLISHKRIDMLLEALAVLRGRGLEFSLLVVGNGPEAANLIALAQNLGLTDLVTFDHDLTTHEELFGALKSARAAVFPSEREGFGVALLEALACGVDVLTTSAPDNLSRYLVTSSGGGEVCAPTVSSLADAVESVLSAPDDRYQVSDAWLSNYGWDAVADRVASVLLEQARAPDGGRHVAH